MSSLQTQHLTDAEFSDLLAGERPTESSVLHLAACPQCSAEMDDLRASLASFSDISGQWAETVAPRRVSVPSRWTLGLMGWPTVATGALVTALTGVLVFNFGPASHAPSTRQAGSVTATRAAVPSKTELANDNRLMLSIDEELSYRAKPEPAVLELGAQGSSTNSGTAEAVVN